MASGGFGQLGRTKRRNNGDVYAGLMPKCLGAVYQVVSKSETKVSPQGNGLVVVFSNT